MAGSGTRNFLTDGIERVGAARGTGWESGEEGSEILRSRDRIGRFVLCLSPLLFGAIQLAEIVDAHDPLGVLIVLRDDTL